MKIKENRNKYSRLIIAVGSIVVVALLLFFFWRVEQAKTGICTDNGRILTEHELRQAVMQNLVDLMVEAANVHERMFNRGTSRVGIVRNPPGGYMYPTAVNIKRLMESAYNNDLSFEENFAIEKIAPSDSDFDVDSLEEPFMLIRYDADRSGSVSIIVSTDVRQVDPPVWPHKSSLYERFCGFGNCFFRIKVSHFSRECCDNRDHGRSREEYLNNKRKKYMESLESFDRNIAVHDNYVMVSNCGDIKTEKSENGLDMDIIKYTYLNQ
jgi:hypothetical protein